MNVRGMLEPHSKGLLAGSVQMERSSDSEALLLRDKENDGEIGKSGAGADFGEDEFGLGHDFIPYPLTQRK